MSALTIGLGAALCPALIAVVVLAFWLPRRVAQLVAKERGRAWAALNTTAAADVATLTGSLRAALDAERHCDRAAYAAAATEVSTIVVAIREMAEWFGEFAAAHYRRALRAQPHTPPTPDPPVAPLSVRAPSGSAMGRLSEPWEAPAGLTSCPSLACSPCASRGRPRRLIDSEATLVSQQVQPTPGHDRGEIVMMTDIEIEPPLTFEELARIDACATGRGVTREEMMKILLMDALEAFEKAQRKDSTSEEGGEGS